MINGNGVEMGVEDNKEVTTSISASSINSNFIVSCP